jgi:hypothetical protein
VVKVGWRQGKALESEEGKAMGSELFWGMRQGKQVEQDLY